MFEYGTKKMSYNDLLKWQQDTKKEINNEKDADGNELHRWEKSELYHDKLDYLIRELDFSTGDAWKWLEDNDFFGDRFYNSLEHNPTTPDSYWQRLLNSGDEGARLTAQDMLGESFSVQRMKKLAGIISD